MFTTADFETLLLNDLEGDFEMDYSETLGFGIRSVNSMDSEDPYLSECLEAMRDVLIDAIVRGKVANEILANYKLARCANNTGDIFVYFPDTVEGGKMYPNMGDNYMDLAEDE